MRRGATPSRLRHPPPSPPVYRAPLAEGEVLRFEEPIRTVSEPNRRDHHAVKAARVAEQRGIVGLLLRSRFGVRPPPPPVEVTLTRIGPGTLDDDNLRGALKAIRDEIAAWFGIDDRDPRIVWQYGPQIRSKAFVYAVRVEIRGAAAAPARKSADCQYRDGKWDGKSPRSDCSRVEASEARPRAGVNKKLAGPS